MLVVVRKELRSFTKTDETLLEAVADYASISLVNSRLFRALHDTTQTTKEAQKRQNAVLESIQSTIAEELQAATYPVDLLLTGKPGKLNEEQKQALQTARAALQRLGRSVEKTTPPAPVTIKTK